MGEGERRHDLEDVDERGPETRHGAPPPAPVPDEHRGQKQRDEKTQGVYAGEKVPDAEPYPRAGLAHGAERRAPECLLPVVRRKDRGPRPGAVVDPYDAAVLWVDIEEER